MRRLIGFPCAGEQLIGTLDEAGGTTGLLIVSGGNEIRMGAHRGMAMLAERVARELDVPVFRFDRRGVGDSTGENRGFEHSYEDIGAAAAAFTAEVPRLRRIVAFGNCDAATALALFHHGFGIDALLLGNPWVITETDEIPPAAAIRTRYASRLRDPRQWLRLATGGVNLIKLTKGLLKLSKARSELRESLAGKMADALAAGVPATILLARGDNTAIAFQDAWRGPELVVRICETDSHSFAHPADKQWLFERVAEAIAP